MKTVATKTAAFAKGQKLNALYSDGVYYPATYVKPVATGHQVIWDDGNYKEIVTTVAAIAVAAPKPVYDLTNADILQLCGVRPSETERGQKIILPKAVENCTFGRNRSHKVIPAGEYVIVSRKYFVAGYHVVEPTGRVIPTPTADHRAAKHPMYRPMTDALTLAGWSLYESKSSGKVIWHDPSATTRTALAFSVDAGALEWTDGKVTGVIKSKADVSAIMLYLIPGSPVIPTSKMSAKAVRKLAQM